MMQRIHKHKKDYSMPDYYKYYCKNYDKIERKLFNSIVTDFNEGIMNLIINEGVVYKFPKIFFELMIKKAKRKAYIKNGKLINSVPIDWKRTNELWEKDAEAKAKKIRVRYNNSHTSGYVFRIYCKKFKCKIKNRSLFKFKPSRKFQRSLSKRIKDPNQDNFDCYLLY